MKIPFVDLNAQYLSIKDNIDEAIQDVLNDSEFIGGERVRKFENQFASLYGARKCISVANGTDALYISMKMLGVGPGDEVITTAHSWISTSETIIQTGATPIFVDIEEDLFTIDPALIKAKITEKTKAIIPVHIYGQMCDMQEIMKIADEHGLFVIEDCAQAHFSELNGLRAGLYGDTGTFSFYPGKNLGAYGDAGSVITNNDSLAEKIRMYANHGALVKHQHQIDGINSRLDTLQAAILSVKLKYILKWTLLRQEKAKMYDELLGANPIIDIPKVRANSRHSYHLYVLRCKKRDEIREYLDEHGIPTVLHYPKILPLLKPYSHFGYSPEDFPVAYKYQHEILSIPIFPELSTDQIHFITNAINSFGEKN
tara:strand:- start:3633 stop:4742 length:1110 start_codon:yes stop_codon:yes gene_type:complete